MLCEITGIAFPSDLSAGESNGIAACLHKAAVEVGSSGVGQDGDMSRGDFWTRARLASPRKLQHTFRSILQREDRLAWLEEGSVADQARLHTHSRLKSSVISLVS